MNWQVGDGVNLKVSMTAIKRAFSFMSDRTQRAHGSHELYSLDSMLAAKDSFGTIEKTASDLERLEGLGLILTGRMLAENRPRSFLHALTNFGVRLFLDEFVELALRRSRLKAAKGGLPAGNQFFRFIF